MKLNQAVPELPVTDVELAQQYYRDVFGCQIEWLYPNKEVGAVSNDESVIFFRKNNEQFQSNVHWIYCEDIEQSYQQLQARKANIIDELEEKPWRLKQFSVVDLNGHIFHFHHG